MHLELWAFLLAGLFLSTMLMGVGSAWDAQWHAAVGRDAFFIPPHLILYSGAALAAVLACFGLVLETTILNEPWRRGLSANLHTQGYRVVGLGSLTMLAAAGFDEIWHRTIGDRSIWSPPHVLGVLGAILIVLGTIVVLLGADGQRMSRRWSRTGVIVLLASLLVTVYFGLVPTAAITFLRESVSFPSPGYADPTFLVVIVSVMMTLLVAATRQLLGSRTFATVTAIALGLWGLMEAFHVMVTPLVASQLGYVLRPDETFTFTFRLLVFAAAVAPALIVDRLSRLPPWWNGVLMGGLYAVEVSLARLSLGLVTQVVPVGIVAAAILGGTGATLGDLSGRWVRRAARQSEEWWLPLLDASRGVLYRFPGFKRSFWHVWYDYWARREPGSDWKFMNYGYTHLSPSTKNIPLAESDEADRYCIQLYHHVASAIDLRGLNVLEVGCGRGGGCSYLTRYLQPRSVVGVDLSGKAIQLCQRFYAIPGLSFVQGDAESLPLPPASFDVVINVESSHCYPFMNRFLVEVGRVLRPNGYFLLADLRHPETLPTLHQQLLSAGFSIVKDETITENVVQAMERDSSRRRVLIEQSVPKLLRSPFRQFAGVKGSRIYESLRTDQLVYFNYVLRKVSS